MKINRRTFIEASALTIAGAVVSPAGIMGSQRQPRSFKAYDAKAKALLSQKDAGMLGEHCHGIVGRLGSQRRAETTQRAGEPDFGPHESDCVIATQRLPTGTRKL